MKSISPPILNPNGTDMIRVEFNTKTEKAGETIFLIYLQFDSMWRFAFLGFELFLNGVQLKFSQFETPSNTTISFWSIPQSESTGDGLRVKVVKRHFLERIMDGDHVEERIINKVFYDDYLRYSVENEKPTGTWLAFEEILIYYVILQVMTIILDHNHF